MDKEISIIDMGDVVCSSCKLCVTKYSPREDTFTYILYYNLVYLYSKSCTIWWLDIYEV
jgi:hypothetical protein